MLSDHMCRESGRLSIASLSPPHPLTGGLKPSTMCQPSPSAAMILFRESVDHPTQRRASVFPKTTKCTLFFSFFFFFFARGNSEQTKKDPHLGGLPSWKSQSNVTALGAQPGCLSKWFCPAGPAGRSSFFSGASPGMGPFGLGWKLSRDCTKAAEPARGQGP